METDQPTNDVVLAGLQVRPITQDEEARYQAQLREHHYLGAIPKIGETIWYVALWQDQWVAQLSMSAAALKCGVRDRWIGWDYRSQYGRLQLVANNSRFLILPDWHRPNIGSRVLSLLERRIGADWQTRFAHPLLLLETFVDPRRFYGGVYRAANWLELGLTKGYRRTHGGYSAEADAPKRVFIRPLRSDCRARLTHPDRNQLQLTGNPKIMLSPAEMLSLPACFKTITDPRRRQGQRHRLPVVLALAAGATLCGMQGYKAYSDWVQSLGQKARERFGCRRDASRRYTVPSLSVIRDCLTRVDPYELTQAINGWNKVWRIEGCDSALAIDGKTMKNAINADGDQTHIMSAIGHESGTCYAQKK